VPSHSKAPPRSGGKRGSSGTEIAARQRELYTLPLDQFTRARDALAKEVASKGRAKEAQAIRKLKRPVVGAWVVNRIAQQHPERIEAFLASARALEKAHRRAMSGLSAEHLKVANRAFQQALDALLKEATASLAATGRPATGDLIRQIEESLRAAALGTEEERSTLVQGMLTRPLQSSGFGSFSPLLLVGPAPRRAAPKPERASPARRTEEAPAPAAPPSGGGKVLRGPWAPREDTAEVPAHPSPAPKRQIARPRSHPPKRQARGESAAEARRQREAELRQLRREAKQRADEAARTERSARQSVVRTQAVLRTTKGKTLAARRALESAESRVLRAREALEAAEELAHRAREELEQAEESERSQEEEAARADKEAAAAERAVAQARHQLKQAESRLHHWA
jgi:hypothetical protein